MPKSIIVLFCVLSFHSFSQVIGGRNNSDMTPKVSEPAKISSGGYSGDVNLFSGAYSSSIPLGSVSTPGGLSYDLSLNYNSSFSIGNTSPISKGIPYGDGWNLNLPTVSIEAEVFNAFTYINYCNENTGSDTLRYSDLGNQALNEGDLYWYSPYISIPGVASGRAIFKYIDESDDKTVVFELNTFETHVEVRYDNNKWTIITADGTIYELSTAIQSYNAPANKRVLYYPPAATQLGNIAWDVASSPTGYNSSSTAGLVENSVTPKQRYNLWYCNAIRHKNKPLQSIVFFYQGFGKFNYFNEFQQEAYKYAASTVFGSSTFAMEQDFSCYSDLLLTKIESYSISGLVNRLDLKYETEKAIINANQNELIKYQLTGNGRLDSLYSYQSVYKDNLSDANVNNWNRYQHTKANSITNANNVNPSNPYLTSNYSYLRSQVTGNHPIPFDHSFLESPRILDNALVAGDIYEVRSAIHRTNGEDLRYSNSTIDVSIVTGSLGNNVIGTNNAFNQFDNNSGPYYDHFNGYLKTRGINVFSTFNMALKWTLSYTENLKQTSNLFVMPNFPSNFHGINIQVGPGNADMNYNAQPSDVSELVSNVTRPYADHAYYFRHHSSVNSAADIPSNFGVGMPWAQMIPIYKKMVTALNPFLTTSDALNTTLDMWWNLDNPSGTPYTHANHPTKMDSSVTLNEIEVIRYSKNPYMLKYVEFYNVNGDMGGLTETGLHLISKKQLEYTSSRERILENYNYQFADSLRYKSNIMQVFVLLSKVREIPLGAQVDTSLLPTTFFSYETFKNTIPLYDISYPLSGHAGKVLTKITDHLGGITKIEYYPSTILDSRTIYNSTLTYKKDCSGISSPPLYGLSSAITVNPVVKTILKNDEDDLVKKDSLSTNAGHKKWTYDFVASSKVYKQTQIQVNIPNFFNTRSASYDVGFKTVTVYGPSLIEGGNTFVNKTVYEHYGYKNSSGIGTPTTEDYLYHGKLKSIKEYDVTNKLFTEKLINYEYTLAYKNGYERPNPVKENLIWEQEYDNPGGQYEYRDYYLNQPLVIGSFVGTAAYSLLYGSGLNGSGGSMELPKSMEFYFYPQLKADSMNKEYLFHSYFIKKTEEIDRKYDDYLFKQAVISVGTLPAPFVNTGNNPFGGGHTNPISFNDALATAQINIINTKTEAAIMDSLLSKSPLMDSVLYHVINTTRISDAKKITLLLAQGNLSNLSLNRFITKFSTVLASTSYSPISVIQQQSYLSDNVLLTTLPKITNRWTASFTEALFLKNEYLSDQVVQALASTTAYFNAVSFTKILSNQPQFSENAIDKIIKSRYLVPVELRTILMNQMITDANFTSIIGKSTILNNTIVQIIETGNKYPSETVFTALMGRSPAFSESEMERIIAVADRDIEPSVLTALIAIYGSKPFLTGFSFKGNPLDAYCKNAVQSNWNYIETKTSYEYYEADYKGTSNGRAYKVLMGLEDIPGRVVSKTDVFGSGGTMTVNSLRLKHEPSWQVFSVTNTSIHLPTAKDEKQYFYLYDLKNRYDRYWYNYDVNDIGASLSSFTRLIKGIDTLMYTTRWDDEYEESYMEGIAPASPKYDGMTKSRQYGMRTTPFQETQIIKNQRDTKELRKSEYYFYDSRWKVDPFSVNQTVEYNGPSCPETGTPPVDPISCESCMRWKDGTEEEFIYQLPFNYCLWKDPVIGYYACPSSINYALCNPGVELIACYPDIQVPEEEGDGPSKMIILSDALKKSLQLRSTVIQLDTILDAVSDNFSKKRFDRSNNYIAEFYMEGSSTELDDLGFVHPYKMLFPYDTLTTARVHKRNQHLQPALISNQVGLLTKFYYNTTKIKWNVNTNCTNPNYSFYYNYSSVDAGNIGLPVRVTVGYMRDDSMATNFEYTNDGQIKKRTTSSGHTMEYAFDDFNRLKSVTENGNRLLSRNEYKYWRHNTGKSFKDRTKENYVYSVLYQNATDTATTREFQKAFMDPLGRTAGVVKAYRGWGDVQISSGSILYDNWGRSRIQYKTIDSTLTLSSPDSLKHLENLTSPLYDETKYDNDPGSLDIKHADPGISIMDTTTVKKQTWITNAIYMSCELGLSKTELNLVMNSGSTGGFRFVRTSAKDQDNKENITYTNALGQTVATFTLANTSDKVRTLYIYDSYGNLIKTINPERQNTNYQYNMIGQLVRETNVDGGEKRYIYNKHGKISGVQDQMDRNNLNSSNVSAPRFRKFTYDIYGNLIDQSLVINPYHLDPFCFQNKTLGVSGTPYIDPQNNPHYFEYVFSNRMTHDWLNTYKTLNPSNTSSEITSYGLPAVTPTATVFQEKFMVYGTSQSSPSTLGRLVDSYSYGPPGLTVSTAIQKISYTYNSEDLLASQAIIQHPSNIATNDPFLVKATILYSAYNFRGALLEEKLDMGSNGSVEMKYFYDYDELNRLKKVFVAQADSSLSYATEMVNYKYDDAKGTVLTKKLFTHNAMNSLIENQRVDYGHDKRDRLTGMGSVLFSEQLYYDSTTIPAYNSMSVAQTNAYNGNVKGTRMKYNFATASNSSIPLFAKETVYGYLYDRINRLVKADALVGDIIDAQFGNPSNLNQYESYSIGDETWRYDRIGNIIIQNRTKPGTAVNIGSQKDEFNYTYANGTNRLTKVEDLIAVTTRNYTYDVNGNLLTDDFRDIDATTYIRGAYPHQVTQSSDNSYYLYDNGDQRIFKKVVALAQTTQEMYIKDALGRDLSIVKFKTDSTTTTSSSEYFVYGMDRVARVTTGSSGSIPSRVYFNEAAFFLYDHLGNTRVVFSVDGSNVPLIANAMDYYSYGKILREYNNGARDRYLTTGHERDQKTGLDYRGARYYDSDIARFLSLDPLASKYPELSAYVYVADNPVILVDEDGKEIKYSIEIAVAMAARGSGNGYSTKVVPNPTRPGDYGVSFTRTVGGQTYKGTQYEGKFTGITDIGRRNLSLSLERQYKNSSGWYTPTSNFNAGVGTVATGLELSSSSFRLTNGVANGSKLSPKVYVSGWIGGSRASISTYKTAGVATAIGRGSFGLGVALDGIGVYNYYTDGADSPNAVHPIKAAVNTGVGAFALELNPIVGIVYTGIDAFYPGGWVGLGNDQERLNQENKAINPDWQLWPGAMKQ